MATVSPDIQWQVIRKNSSFLRRQRGIPKHFSREKFNLKGVNSIRYNGLIRKKGLDIQAAPDGKSIRVTTKIRTKTALPCQSSKTDTLKKDSRKTLKSVKNIAATYRCPHVKLAERRASQLLRSVKPTAARRKKHKHGADI